MSRRAEQYEQNERAKARARVNQSPITEATDAHNMGEIRASDARIGNPSTLTGLVLLETIKRNNAAYESVMPQLEEIWKLIQVKRRFDRSQ
jgi:hypothetical protein